MAIACPSACSTNTQDRKQNQYQIYITLEYQQDKADQGIFDGSCAKI